MGLITKQEEQAESLEGKVIASNRYNVLNLLGRGCWGAVYLAKDMILEEEVAIKVLEPNEIALKQMAHRNIDFLKAMKKEAGKLTACSHVVPRVLEFDNNEKPFLVMPPYERFLSDKLHDDSSYRCYLGHGMSIDDILRYMRDVAIGLSEIHTKIGRAHGDLKPDNIAIDHVGRALLNDLGTSTCASYGRSVSPRDNMGFIYTRAPECFKEDSHPDKKSDIWSFGSLLYRMFTGKYILEDEINKEIELDEKIDAVIKQRIKKNRNIPKQFKKFLIKCLAFNPYGRFYDGSSLSEQLAKAMNSMYAHNEIMSHIKKWTLPLGIPITLLGLCIYGAAVHEPTELTMPKVQMTGTIIPGESMNEKILEFEREDLGLEPITFIPPLMQTSPIQCKRATNNRYAAYLLKTHIQAVKRMGFVYADFHTEEQWKIYLAYTIPEERRMPTIPRHVAVVAKSIEVALTKSQNPDGKVDLEDVCAITRLGVDKVNEARKAADSFDFKDYVKAKDSNGEYIVPKKEQKFLEMWLRHIH